MAAAGLEIAGKPEIHDDRGEESAQRLARVSGLLYLVLFIFGMFSPLVLEGILTPGDAAATTEKITDSLGLFGISIVTWIVIIAADIAISVTLYLLLEPAGRALSMVTAALRIVYSAVLGAFLLNLVQAFTLLNGAENVTGVEAPQLQATVLSAVESFADGFVLALMFFGIHLVLPGVLLVRSSYMPRSLGVLMAVAGVGYVADGLANFFMTSHSDTATIILLAPALVGELALTVWLLLKGVQAPAATDNQAA